MKRLTSGLFQSPNLVGSDECFNWLGSSLYRNVVLTCIAGATALCAEIASSAWTVRDDSDRPAILSVGTRFGADAMVGLLVGVHADDRIRGSDHPVLRIAGRSALILESQGGRAVTFEYITTLGCER